MCPDRLGYVLALPLAPSLRLPLLFLSLSLWPLSTATSRYLGSLRVPCSQPYMPVCTLAIRGPGSVGSGSRAAACTLGYFEYCGWSVRHGVLYVQSRGVCLLRLHPGSSVTSLENLQNLGITPVIYPTVRDDFGLISMIEMDFAPVRMTGRMSGKSEMPHFCNEKRPDQGKLLTLAV